MDKELSFTIKEGGTSGPTIGEGERMIQKLVDKRKSIWREKESLDADRAVCRDNADIILDTPILRDAVVRKPYLLIECCFSLVNKKKRDAPFFFNRVQRDFIERLGAQGTKRPFFILKGRQQGFTTLITAIQLSFAIVRRNFSGFTVADRELYTLSFSCDGYTGEFSVSVYDSAPVTVAKGGRTSVSFIYDKSKFGGAVPVCDSVRTANSAELYNFTVLKGTEKIYVPVSLPNNSITLHSCGKNLLNPLAFAAAPVEGGESIYEGNSLTLVSKSSDCYTSIYYEPIKISVNPNEEITFSWEINSGAPTGMVYIFGNGTTESMTSALASKGQLTYKVPEGISFITYRVGVAGIGNRITYSNLQIERSSVPTEYEPYIQGESVSLALDEVAFLTPISPCMNIYTHDSIGVCQGEFLKSGALIKATELIFADPDHKVNSHITSATAEYSQTDGKIRLNLFNDSKLITNVDMTDAIQSFVVKEILGGLI